MTKNKTIQSNTELISQYTSAFSQSAGSLTDGTVPQKDAMSHLGGNTKAHEVIDLAQKNATSLQGVISGLSENLSSIAKGIEAVDQGISQSMGSN